MNLARILPLALALLFCSPLHSADIVALCIGNDRYAKPEDILDTPVADARLMKRTLEALPGGADVALLEDASREDIVIELNSLAQRARGAKLVLVYYSGHGLEGQPDGYAKADTFLLPVEAEIPDVNYLPARAVGVQTVLEALGKCPVTARAVILDCCRDGAPRATAALKGATKSFGDIDEAVKAALGAAAVPEATLVAFAAGPGRKAAAFLRQSDANSPFTFFLSESLATGAGNLRDLVEAAAEQTEVATGKRQVPQVTYTGAASAIRQIVFRATATAAPPVVVEVPSVPSTPAPMVKTDPAPAPAFPASRGMEGGRAGEVREFGGIQMIWCPPGEFLMGSPEDEEGHEYEETQYRVRLSKGYWMAKTECTQQQWKSATGDNPSAAKGEDFPVEHVSWDKVRNWLEAMNRKHPLPEGWKWDLPTEAQWEYACRAGTATVFSFGNRANGMEANCLGSDPYGTGEKGPTLRRAEKAGSYDGNPWGFHDMHGNVREWCRDWYADYPEGLATDPEGPARGVRRVVRGGGWGDSPRGCRSASRHYEQPSRADGGLGFRPCIAPTI